MKIKTILSAFVALMLMLTACGLAEDAKLTVQGTGVVSLDPDTATITLGVRASAADVGDAQAEVNEKLSAVVEKLKSMGVAEEDIHTSSINIYEDYDYGSDDYHSERYYAASNSISVTIKDIENSGSYIDAVFEAGANSFSGISFSASDTEAAKKRALELAVQNAGQKAEVLAGAAGMAISGISAVTEQGSGMYGYYDAGNSLDVVMEKESAGAGTLVFSEQIQVSATVTVVYTMAQVE